MRWLPALFVLLLAAGCALSAAAQPLAAADSALRAGAFAEAEALLREAVAADERSYEAWYRLARLFVETPLADEARAVEALRALRRLDRRAVRTREAELLRAVRFPGTLLPMLRDTRRARRAEALLADDPGNGAARLVLGLYLLEAYEATRSAVLPPPLAEAVAAGQADADYVAALGRSLGRLPADARISAFAEAEVVASDSGRVVQLYDRTSGNAVAVLADGYAAQPALRRAYDHLVAALAAERAPRAALRPFMQVVVRAERCAEALPVLARAEARHGAEASFWLYRGYCAFRTGAVDAADAWFDAARARLAPGERAAADSLSFLTPDEQARRSAAPEAFAEAYWATRDPRLLTAVNERRLEHYARLAFAELRYGDPDRGRRGWDTDPGRVVVRYGEPPVELRLGDPFERHILMHYGDLEFRVMQLRDAAPVFFSPSAKVFSNPRSAALAVRHDYSLKGPATFRAEAARFAYDPARRLAMPFAAYRFEGARGPEVALVAHPPVTGQGGFFAQDLATGAVHGEARFAAGAAPVARVLPLAPGRYALVAEVEGAEQIAFERDTLTVAARSGLRLSDLILAGAVEEGPAGAGGLQRGPLAVTPHLQPQTRPRYLYAEVYGLPPAGTLLTVDAVVGPDGKEASWWERLLRPGGAPEEGVAVRFQQQAVGPSEALYFLLDLGTLPAGAYRLRLRVAGPEGGPAVEQEHSLQLF